jgi:predicted exporter
MKKAGKFLGILFLVILSVAYVGTGLSRISVDVDILRLLPTKLKQVEGLSLFLKHFALPEELIVTVDASDSNEANAAVLAISKALKCHPELLKDAVSEAPWESNPASLSEFLSFSLLNQPVEKLRAVMMNLTPEQSEKTLQETLETLNSSVSPLEVAMLSYDPFRIFSSFVEKSFSGLAGSSEFSSQDGTFRVIYVQAVGAFENYKQTALWINKIKAICAEATAKTDVRLGFTGEPAFVAEISTGMENDMKTSAPVTLGLISLIFWICYGRFLPLLGLLLMLQLIFVFTLGTAGLVLNELTVAGVGFASVMIGLSVDYGYFVYQRSLTHTGSTRSLQWDCIQSIIWTAGTTAAAFFALNFSSLPGLSQLGNMVGIGVCIGAVIMLGIFAPLVKKIRKTSCTSYSSRLDPIISSDSFSKIGFWVTLSLVGVFIGTLLVKGLPSSDFSSSTFRPRNSESHQALSQLYTRLQDSRACLSLIVSGKNEEEIWRRLKSAEDALETAKSNGYVTRILSPLTLWPTSATQSSNLEELLPLTLQKNRLKKAITDNGFTEEAFALTSSVLDQVAEWKNSSLPIWPSDPASAWILRRMARHEAPNYLAFGVVEPVAGYESTLVDSIQAPGVHLVSWTVLGEELKQTLPKEILNVSAALIAGILLILLIALRSIRSVLVFAVTTALVLVCLAGAMSLFDMKWGFFSLAAVLLLLGTGTDYSILLLLAFKRCGNAGQAQKQCAAVIFLCSSSSIAGFATLGWASNLGLATLGQTCAIGLLIDAMISLFLLPHACRYFLEKRNAPAMHFCK